ncbi:hypothetical protein [Schlesneria paludicola]|uniref:hypothetical protein n=1 Tax=Schlesneria paludicola TaxID=360056 RepID=UPI00029AADA4|nr:hypothetical protein [Schlesneria paludicola]
MIHKTIMFGLLISGLAFNCWAQDAKNDSSKVVHSKVTDAKKCCGSACTVNFPKELGLSLEYLDGIGHRISVARKSPDPVELALAAQALSVAEKVSGKKASITSEQILTEALELAKLRGISNELSAVAILVPESKADFDKQISIAKKREAEAKQKTESGEGDKELLGRLTVINHSGECLKIFVSGRYKGTVHEGETISFHVHDHNQATRLDAICESDNDLVSQQFVFGHNHDFIWHVH